MKAFITLQGQPFTAQYIERLQKKREKKNCGEIRQEGELWVDAIKNTPPPKWDSVLAACSVCVYVYACITIVSIPV